MSNKNLEMMKKLIEEKKNKSLGQNGSKRPQKSIGGTNKGFTKGSNGGGLFDK